MPVAHPRSPTAVDASFTLLVACALLFTACGSPSGSSSQGAAAAASGAGAPGVRSAGWHDDLTGVPDKLDVATTVAPISSIARNIGGTNIRLHGLIPDATNSHTFEPTPSDAKVIANADLIVVNGLHLEQPTLALAQASKRGDAQVRMLGESAISRDEWLFDFSFPESKGDPNPHIWMDPRYALRYAELLRDWFSVADPANTAAYGANFDAYKARLVELDADIRTAIRTIPEPNRKLLTYHDSWAYWAREYGFTVIGAVQASDFSDPSPADVARLIDQIKAEKVPAIFGSEVFPSPVLEQIARESGAKFIDALRDDEPPGDQGAPEHTYLGMLKKDMVVMVEALGGSGKAFDPLQVADTYAGAG